jgi:hypothetical protein
MVVQRRVGKGYLRAGKSADDHLLSSFIICHVLLRSGNPFYILNRNKPVLSQYTFSIGENRKVQESLDIGNAMTGRKSYLWARRRSDEHLSLIPQR